jgi:hypothetical protein
LAGHDTWSGTLVVPGFEFDLVPPTITGAADTRVRAPRKAQRIRVRYHVSARDDVDGAVPVACKPKSGSFFRVGRRTIVRCSATDTSANTQDGSVRDHGAAETRRLARAGAGRDRPRSTVRRYVDAQEIPARSHMQRISPRMLKDARRRSLRV